MSERQKLAVNSIAMLANRVTQGITAFGLTAAIARTLGAEALGQYLLAMNYYCVFVYLASQGFRTLFTRELTHNPEATPNYLVSGTLLQLVFALLGYVVLGTLVFILPYSDTTSFICYGMGVMIIPYSLSNVTEAIFQSQEKMHLIAISTVPIYVLRLLTTIWLLQSRYDLPYIIGALVLSETLVLIVQWILLISTVKPKWQIDWDFIWKTIRAARTFFAIEGIGIIASRVDLVILSLLANEALVGIYGAICQLLQPYYIVANSIASAAFPSMSKAVSKGKEAQRKLVESTIEILLCISLPFLTGIFFLGDKLLLSIYQDPSFAKEALILHIISVSLITSAFSRIFSYLLIVNGLEKLNLIEVISTTVVGSLTGIVLIVQYKLIGAALMSVTTSFANFAVMAYFVYDRLFHVRLFQIVRRPLLISLLMSIVFFGLSGFHVDLIPTVILATCVYLGLTSLLIFRKPRGVSL